jgi:hypothetical protein
MLYIVLCARDRTSRLLLCYPVSSSPLLIPSAISTGPEQWRTVRYRIALSSSASSTAGYFLVCIFFLLSFHYYLVRVSLPARSGCLYVCVLVRACARASLRARGLLAFPDTVDARTAGSTRLASPCALSPRHGRRCRAGSAPSAGEQMQLVMAQGRTRQLGGGEAQGRRHRLLQWAAAEVGAGGRLGQGRVLPVTGARRRVLIWAWEEEERRGRLQGGPLRASCATMMVFIGSPATEGERAVGG